MRKVYLAALFVFVVASPARAQNWANKLFGGDPKKPIVKDFGNIAKGAQLEATLTMKNIWQVPITITKIHVECGCVEATPSKMTLQPNESGTLNIKMDGSRFEGQKTVPIHVIVGPNFVSSANILVSANARRDVTVNPGEIDFQNVPRGSTATRSLEVECAGKPNWKVTQVAKSQNAPFDLKTEVLPVRMSNGAQIIGYRIIATLKPTAPIGPFREPVDIFTTDSDKVTFMVVGNVQPSIAVSPNPVELLGLKVGAPYKTQIVVTAEQKFRIVDIQGNDADAKLGVVPQDPPDRKVQFVEFNITPKTAGALHREFTLQTDMRNETVKVVVKGKVNP